MDFDAILDQAIALLQRRGRLTYRALKVQFALTEEQLDALREELMGGRGAPADEGGKVLYGKGERVATGQTSSNLASSPAPISYTPAHLAERIRATEVTD